MDRTNLYLMKDGNSGYHKIGVSIDPQFREKTLLSQAPCIELHSYWKDQSRDKEQWLHRRFDDKRIRGEWFRLERADVDYIYFHFADVERVDIVEPPAHLRIWCQLQTARLAMLKNRPVNVVEKVVEKTQYVTKEIPVEVPRSVSGLGITYSARTLRDMRVMIEQSRRKQQTATNPDLYSGFIQGIVWASGVD